MNNDLISREALKKAIDKFHQETLQDDISINALNRLIDYAPTVAEDYDTGYQDGLEDGLNDIRPKGEWIGGMKCSICGEFSSDNGNFCTNCGADMRGNNNE